MRDRGPVITLVVVAALAAVLFMVNERTVAEIAARSPVPVTAGPQPTVPRSSEADRFSEADRQSADVPARPPGIPRPTTYAGRTSGNEATIAIVADGDAVSAYVCDGKQTDSWLQGTITDGRLTLQGGDGVKVTGSVRDGAVFGTVWVRGGRWPYSAQRAEAPAGLYQGEATVDGAPARAGWIVLQDGSQVGVADVGGVPRPAPAIDPRQLSGVELRGSVLNPEPVDSAGNVVEPPS